jgi:hypothetical protein
VLDGFDSRQLVSLRRSWEKIPPLYQIVAAFAGVKRVVRPQHISTPEEAQMMMNTTGGKIPGIGSM